MDSIDFVNVTKVEDFYQWLIVDLSDKRTEDWLFISSPFPIVTVLVLYLAFTLYFGPKFMESRKPFKLKELSIIINILHIVICAFVFHEALTCWMTYNWVCQNVVYTDTPLTRRALRACYVFFVCKALEMVDTVIFVFRKSFRQITFLHIYHHTLMFAVAWMAVKYLPGGHGTFMGLLNSLVHVVMYTHYLICIFNSSYPGYIHVKKAITIFQIVQFSAIIIHTSFLFFTECGYPSWYVYAELPNDAIMFYLFGHFYYKAYYKNYGKFQVNASRAVDKHEI